MKARASPWSVHCISRGSCTGSDTRIGFRIFQRSFRFPGCRICTRKTVAWCPSDSLRVPTFCYCSKSPPPRLAIGCSAPIWWRSCRNQSVRRQISCHCSLPSSNLRWVLRSSQISHSEGHLRPPHSRSWRAYSPLMQYSWNFQLLHTSCGPQILFAYYRIVSLTFFPFVQRANADYYFNIVFWIWIQIVSKRTIPTTNWHHWRKDIGSMAPLIWLFPTANCRLGMLMPSSHVEWCLTFLMLCTTTSFHFLSPVCCLQI